MSGLPLVQIPELVLISKGGLGGSFPPADFSIKPFGTLVAIGVYVGGYLMVSQARKRGLLDEAAGAFAVYVVACGFIFGHVLDTVFYYPEKTFLWEAGSALPHIVKVWEGLSSFGGFCGAVIGALLWRLRYQTAFLPYADVTASAFPAAWVFGRGGCATAHDHPGLLSSHWFAVRCEADGSVLVPQAWYPEACGDIGARFDLGLIEMSMTIPLAVAFLFLRKRRQPWGFFLGAMCIAYAPTRFALDFLREGRGHGGDLRYAALTPAQWLSFALLAAGVVVLWRALNNADSVDEQEPRPPEEDEEPPRKKKRRRRRRAAATA